MRTIHDYMNLVSGRHPTIKSDRGLALALGLGETATHFWRHGRSLPADDTMLRLADLAGVDPGEALVELNIWRSQSPETREQYSRIAAKIKSSVARVLVFGVTSALVAVASPAQGEQTPHESTLKLAGYTLCDLNLLWLRLMRRICLYFQTTCRRIHQKFTTPGHVSPLIVPVG